MLQCSLGGALVLWCFGVLLGSACLWALGAEGLRGRADLPIRSSYVAIR